MSTIITCPSAIEDKLEDTKGISMLDVNRRTDFKMSRKKKNEKINNDPHINTQQIKDWAPRYLHIDMYI